MAVTHDNGKSQIFKKFASCISYEAKFILGWWVVCAEIAILF